MLHFSIAATKSSTFPFAWHEKQWNAFFSELRQFLNQAIALGEAIDCSL
jgi:hypothetical protein